MTSPEVYLTLFPNAYAEVVLAMYCDQEDNTSEITDNESEMSDDERAEHTKQPCERRSF